MLSNDPSTGIVYLTEDDGRLPIPPDPATEVPGESRSSFLYRYLPRFRGITVYPNGAIAGQPIVRVPLREALEGSNLLVEESEDKCASGVCGI